MYKNKLFFSSRMVGEKIKYYICNRKKGVIRSPLIVKVHKIMARQLSWLERPDKNREGRRIMPASRYVKNETLAHLFVQVFFLPGSLLYYLKRMKSRVSLEDLIRNLTYSDRLRSSKKFVGVDFKFEYSQFCEPLMNLT